MLTVKIIFPSLFIYMYIKSIYSLLPTYYMFLYIHNYYVFRYQLVSSIYF